MTDAAWDAAGDAARDAGAARAALAPTVLALRESANALYDRLIGTVASEQKVR